MKGYRFHVVSSDAFGQEKLDTMRALGADLEVIESRDGKITPELINKIIDRAAEIASEPNAYFTNQLSNPDIIDGFEKMGQEIIEQIGRPIGVLRLCRHCQVPDGSFSSTEDSGPRHARRCS